MTARTQAALHEEHVAWREEHAAWRDEAETWAAQAQRALAALARIEALLRDHGAAVLEHGADLGEHEAALVAHERALGTLQRAGLAEQHDPAAPDHERWETRHRAERDAHLRARARHRAGARGAAPPRRRGAGAAGGLTVGAPLLFALDASRPLGEAVGRALGAPLAAHEERDFEGGQHKARSLVNVRGRDAFVLHSLHGDARQSANDKLCRLLFFIGALRDAGAARVTAVVPFLCYARKDRKTKPRDPVTTRYVAQLFEAVGTDRVVTVDVHNLAAFQNAFRCRTDHLEARRPFVEHFAPRLAGARVAVASPDVGGVPRAEAFREALARGLGRDVASAFVDKRRSEGVVSGHGLVGDVTGREVVLLDDMIVSGTTTLRAAQACLAAGATRVHAAATHGAFTPAAAQALADPALTSVVVLGTVPPAELPEELIRRKLVVLDAAPLLAEAIRRLHEGGSIVDLLAC